MKKILIKVPRSKPWIRVPRNTETIILKHRGTKRLKQKLRIELIREQEQ